MKIAICIPSRGHPKQAFTASLRALDRRDLDSRIFTRTGKLIENRNALAADALAWGADAILWLDDDHTFPPETLRRLAGHGKDIVGCNTAKKIDPSSPTAIRLDADNIFHAVWTPPDIPEAAPPQPIDSLSLGVCLVRREVHEAIGEPWFSILTGAEGRWMTEDHHFCLGARHKGFGVFVDHWLSWRVGHIGEDMIYTQRKVLLDRTRYLMTRQNGLISADWEAFQRDYC